MNQLIYTKYSDERSPKFSLYTEIWENENGKRMVRKVPECKEGWGHLKHIRDCHDHLEKLYADKNIGINSCRLTEEGLELAYLTGNTYESMIDQVLEEEGTGAAVEKLKAFMQLVIAEDKQNDFYVTDEFEHVFGKTEFLDAQKSLPVTNIDMIMSNMLLVGEQYHLIDYEWTFDFPIPVKYVIYRIIHYYIECNVIRESLRNENLYEEYEISKEEQKQFAKMEWHFQRYIEGERVPIRDMHKDISPGAFPVQYLVAKQAEIHNHQMLQVYFSYGEGFEEKNSSYYRMQDGHIDLWIEVPAAVTDIRIDPGTKAGICTIKCLTELEDQNAVIPYSTSGYPLQDNQILFEDTDPNFAIRSNSAIRKLHIILTMEYVSDQLLEQIKQRSAETREAVERLRQQEMELQKVTQKKLEAEQRIAHIESQKAYKLYRAIKKIDKGE